MEPMLKNNLTRNNSRNLHLHLSKLGQSNNGKKQQVSVFKDSGSGSLSIGGVSSGAGTSKDSKHHLMIRGAKASAAINGSQRQRTSAVAMLGQ